MRKLMSENLSFRWLWAVAVLALLVSTTAVLTPEPVSASHNVIVVDDDGIRFRDQLITLVELEAARARFHSIGSCSFDVPLSDLQRAGWFAS